MHSYENGDNRSNADEEQEQCDGEGLDDGGLGGRWVPLAAQATPVELNQRVDRGV